jgi:hypothetical protein
MGTGLWAHTPSAVAQTPPASPRLSTVGIVAEQRQAGKVSAFTLKDGRTVSVDGDTTRQVHGGAGPDTLLVVGMDAQGLFYALVGQQDGLPPTCHVLNEAGTEWGGGIEVAGVLWEKAPGFSSTAGSPALDQPYPGGTRFCIDGDARVSMARGQ